MTKKSKHIIIVATAVLLSLVSIFIIFLLSNAYFITDKNGLYQYYVVPISGSQSAHFRLYESANKARDIKLEKQYFGPIFRLNEKDERIAKWICNDQIYRENTLGADSYQIQCNGETHLYSLTTVPTKLPNSIKDKEVYAFSDLHGNVNYLKKVLVNLGIVDGNHNWIFSENGIVLTGDFIDKTSDDRDLLWFIYDLEQQAAAQGGFVLVLLGNHEIFQLHGDFRHAHPVSVYLTQKISPLNQALDKNTILGSWLRSKSIVANLDDLLFVHGGLSPQMRDIDDVLSLNNALSDYWQGKVLNDTNHQLIFGPFGVLNYRGMIKDTSFYSTLTQQQFDVLASQHDFKKVIFGHTEVNEISFLFNDKAIAIDSSRHSSKVLKLKDNQLLLVDSAVINTSESWKKSSQKIPFDLFSSSDWQLIASGIN